MENTHAGAVGRLADGKAFREALAETALVAGVTLTHPQALRFVDIGLTKLDLALYYERIADWLLPHLRGRPLRILRCPEWGECFFQSRAGQNSADDETESAGEVTVQTTAYLVVDEVPALMGLVQIGAIELHAWQGCVDQLDMPDRMVFDLDPDEGLSAAALFDAARRMRRFLQQLGLQSFVKTSGGKGLHLQVPLQREQGWAAVNDFAQAVAQKLQHEDPDRFTADPHRRSSKGKVFVDFLRNVKGATMVSAYSVRALPGAPISMPLCWEALEEDVNPAQFTVQTVFHHLHNLGHDPWQHYAMTRQHLTPEMRQAVGLSE